MATNESMGRDSGSDEFGGPQGWKALLEKFSQKSKVPIINAGHFGGATPAKGSTHNWPLQFACYMDTQEGRRFYGDLGYWDELAACDAKKSHSCEPLNRLKGAIAAHPVSANRIMYGSDWFMLSKEAQWNEYAQRIWHATQSLNDIVPGFDKKLFYTNAIACFGFYKGTAQYQRIDKRLGRLAWIQHDGAPVVSDGVRTIATDC